MHVARGLLKCCRQNMLASSQGVKNLEVRDYALYNWVGAAMSPVEEATSPTFGNVTLCLGKSLCLKKSFR